MMFQPKTMPSYKDRDFSCFKYPEDTCCYFLRIIACILQHVNDLKDPTAPGPIFSRVRYATSYIIITIKKRCKFQF